MNKLIKKSQLLLLTLVLILFTSCKQQNEVATVDPTDTTGVNADTGQLIGNQDDSETEEDSPEPDVTTPDGMDTELNTEKDTVAEKDKILKETEPTTNDTKIVPTDSEKSLKTNAFNLKINSVKFNKKDLGIKLLSEDQAVLEISVTFKNTTKNIIALNREYFNLSYSPDSWFIPQKHSGINKQLEDDFQIEPGKSVTGSLFYVVAKNIDSITLGYIEHYGEFTTPDEYQMIIPIK